MRNSTHSKVKEWLSSGRKLTPKKALNKWGCFRLAPIVERLRKTMTIDMVRTGKQGFATYQTPKK